MIDIKLLSDEELRDIISDSSSDPELVTIAKDELEKRCNDESIT